MLLLVAKLKLTLWALSSVYSPWSTARTATIVWNSHCLSLFFHLSHCFSTVFILLSMLCEIRDWDYFFTIRAPDFTKLTWLTLVHMVEIIGIGNPWNFIKTLVNNLNGLVSGNKVLHYHQVLLQGCLFVLAISSWWLIFRGSLIKVFLVDVWAARSQMEYLLVYNDTTWFLWQDVWFVQFYFL